MGSELTPLVIKLTNFCLYSAAGCIIPYASVYFLHYTEATSSDVGLVMFLASLLGIVLSLTFSSIGDRYRAHRLVYIVSLCLNFLSFAILFGPILLSGGSSGGGQFKQPNDTNRLELETTNLEPDEFLLSEPVDDNDEPPYSTHILWRAATPGGALASGLLEQPQPPASLELAASKFWFYTVAACLGLGTMTLTVNISMCDSFTTEIATKCRTSYGAVRLWGSIGLLFSSTILIFLNQVEWAPFLAPALSMFALLTLANILAVALWPDARPFELAGPAASEGEPEMEPPSLRVNSAKLELDCRKPAIVDKTKPNEMQAGKLRFVDRLSSLGGPTTWRSSSLDLRLQEIIRPPSGRQLVALSRARQNFAFDAASEEACRNVRRCSLAPLGDLHLLKQFELSTTKGGPTSLGGCGGGGAARRHFNFVTIVEPAAAAAVPQLPPQESVNTTGPANELVSYYRLEKVGLAKDKGEANKAIGSSRQASDAWKPDEPMGLRLQVKIVQLIGERDGRMARFMLLFGVVGFVDSLQLVYLFTYLNALDAAKFRWLSAVVIMSSYLSETVFYKYSAAFTRRLDHSTSLSVVLLVYALRYSLYLALGRWPRLLPFESIVAIELLQSFSMGLFNCVVTGASFGFAREARECVPDMLALGLIDGSRDSLERVNSAVKLTLLSLASCCHDGLGVALGSLVGGWLIEGQGFAALWLAGAAIALAFGLWNLAARTRARPSPRATPINAPQA